MRLVRSVSPPYARRLLVAALALAMIAATALLGLSSRASAAEISAIDPASVTITKCTDGDVAECETTPASDTDMSDLYRWQAVRIDMDWSAHADAKAGDTFSVQLTEPLSAYSFSVQLTEPLSAYSGSFDLMDGSGVTVGTCAASHDTGLVTCTLTDYVETHENVAGSLWFSAQATTATETTRNPVTIDGEAVAMPVPGVIDVGDPATQSDSKGGWVNYPRTPGGNASVTWVVLLGSDSVTDENGIDLVDTLGSAQNFDPDLSTLDVTYAIVGQDRTDEGVSVTLDPSRYTAVLNNERELALHLPNLHTEGLVAPGTEYQYRIWYTTRMLDAQDVPAGTVFRNSATYDGKTMSSRVEYANIAGGSADGTIPVGAFTVAKTVEGVPADVASGLSFTVLASYEKDGQQVTEEIVLSGDGTPSGLSGIPQGTVVSLSEPQVAVEGYDFQDLEFTAITENDAIVIGEGGDSATVTITNGTLRLGLSNTYAPSVEETTTPPVEETTTPATTPATTAPGTTPATTPVTTAPGTSPATSGNPSSTTQQAAPVASGTPSSPAPQGTSVLRLPRTGADVAIWGAIGAGMIRGGLILVGYARRYRDSRR